MITVDIHLAQYILFGFTINRLRLNFKLSNYAIP
jgi:hypothetical protein